MERVMIIAIKKPDGKTVFIPARLTLPYWRAFRAALWARGIKRDPKEGDEIDGVRIIGLTI